MRAIVSLPLLVLAAATLSACATSSSKFACPNPQGVTCMSATDVYAATNSADEVIGVDPEEARRLALEGRSAGKVATSGVPVTDDVAPVPVSHSAPAAPAAPRVLAARDGDTLVITGVAPMVAPVHQAVASSALTPSAQPVPRATAPTGEPYLEAAKIMRIYIRPWEDDKGDLHMGGYVFSEIEPRKWSLARRAPSTDSTFHLLHPPAPSSAVDKRDEAAAAPPRTPLNASAAPPDSSQGN